MNRQLWIPGPTEVSPEILAEGAKPMVGHRSQAMEDLLKTITPGLRTLFETEQNVLVFAASASGVMEAAVRNTVKSRVLCCVNGAFSQRWLEIAKSCGKQAQGLEIPWGEGFTGEEIEEELHRSGPYDALTLVHNETSTGALSDLAEVGKVMRKFPQTLFLVDTVSSLGGCSVSFDRNGMDVCLAGVQKALALPPGLTVAAVSKRALERAKTISDRGWYFDFVLWAAAMEKNSTPATPAIPQLFSLRKQLERIEKNGGWSKRYEEHRQMAKCVDDWARTHGIESFPNPEFRSPTTACLLAGKINVEKLITGLKERGFTISNGYGKLKGQTFRIGHMGDHTVGALQKLLAATEGLL